MQVTKVELGAQLIQQNDTITSKALWVWTSLARSPGIRNL